MIKLRIHRNEYATSAVSSETPIKWDFFTGRKKVYNHFTTFKLCPDVVCHKKRQLCRLYVNLHDNDGILLEETLSFNPHRKFQHISQRV